MVSDAVRFIEEYNRVTAAVTQSLRLRPRPLKGAAVQEAEAYLVWAKGAGVDPVLFMRARHDAAPGARIPISKLHRVSPMFLTKYAEWGEWKQSKVATEERYQAVDDNGEGLTPLHESGRMALADDPLVCMLSTPITGGWHPESMHCQRCEKAKECRMNLSTETRRKRDWRARVRG